MAHLALRARNAHGVDPQAREALRLVPAALGDDAPLIGAAELAFEPLLADPSLWTRPAVATA